MHSANAFRRSAMASSALLGLCLALPLAAGCSHAVIPGTTVRDTDENRSVLEVVARYRNALQARDADAVMELVAPNYYDVGDTRTREGGVDRDALAKRLRRDFEIDKEIHLDLTVKEVTIEKDHANVDVFLALRHAVQLPSGEKRWKNQSDDARLQLQRTGRTWKIISGL